MTMKEKLCKSLGFQFLLLSVVGIFVYNTFAYGENEEEWMPDPALREAIREKLGVPADTPLTQAYVQLRLTGLRGISKGIVDLTGLEHATDLQSLVLNSNKISDLSPLSGLTGLVFLDLGNNEISDLSPLADLINLEVLGLSGNQITDVSPLAGLVNLKNLTLIGNEIADLSPLAGLANLWLCATTSIPAEDWMPDPNLRKAVRQKLSMPMDILLTPACITQMKNLDIRAMNITNLTGLEHAVNLRVLIAYDNQIQDLRPLANLKEIHYLNLGVNQISDLSPLAGLVTLEVLGLSSNHIRDLSPLAGLTNLEDLSLGSNPISDLSPLVGLASLKKLSLNNDQITDLSPLVGLTNLEDLRVSNVTKDIFSTLPLSKWMQFGYDETCDLEGVPISERVENREHPSIFGAFGGGIIINLPELTWAEAWAYHDLTWSSLLFTSTTWLPTPEGLKHLVHIETARKQRDNILSLNPNTIFIVAMNYWAANPGEYPDDWPYWARDELGSIIQAEDHGTLLIDFTYPGYQDYMVKRAIALAKCGLFDGIFFDVWRDDWRNREMAPYYTYDVHEAAITMLRRIREGVDEVRDDFLIIVNTNRSKIPRSAPYVNGTFMETIDPYSHAGLAEIESTLLWSEQNLREPQINCLEGWADKTEPLDSPRNQQWMRLFTTMGLTHSDGYVNFVSGILSLEHEHLSDIWKEHSKTHDRGIKHSHLHDHIWDNFYDAPLGRPVGGDETKGQLYQNREGLFIREFTNGWAVYNRSGKEQEIEFPEVVSGVASGIEEKRGHVLSDLDGEIYLKSASGLETA
ncbi:leucine-rich repeat domain-containing protein, partial [Candidatus Poribacteria bacterium]|nr:leucine-rich repeat domain-containing protein [Candidatus Poribacteria bacterium]